MSLTYLAVETRRTLRSPRALVLRVALPVMLFLLYVQLYGEGTAGGVTAVRYLMVAMGLLGGLAAAMQVGSRVAEERTQGWNRQLRLTPLRPLAYLLGKAIVGMVTALVVIVVIFAVAALSHDIGLSAVQWLGVTAGLWLGVLPFAMIGLLIGYLGTTESVQPMFMLTFMAMSLLGGVFIPTDVLPATLQTIGQVLPSYWAGELARAAMGGTASVWQALAMLAAWSVAVGAAVMWRFGVATRRS